MKDDAGKSPSVAPAAGEQAHQANLRRERLAAALRENLRRRKQQARERREPEPR
jgi:hypothetical protein